MTAVAKDLDRLQVGEPVGYLEDLDEALHRLEKLNERQARVVELRYFTGLTFEEIGEVLAISVRSAKRDWNVARAWLYGELLNK